jgi:hypothetical protein
VIGIEVQGGSYDNNLKYPNRQYDVMGELKRGLL